MKESTALVVGATGLIGRSLIDQLIQSTHYNRIVALVRKWDGPLHPKLEIVTVDFDRLLDYEQSVPPGQTVFCCVGTTQKKVKGDKTAYRKVDYDIAVNTATLAIKKGYEKYMLVSAVGANKQSSNFYLQLKGEVEEAISGFGFRHTGLFRPSFLMGERKEKRTGEAIATILSKIFSVFLRGSLSRYHAISAVEVARAMIYASLQTATGTTIYYYKEIKSAQ